MGRRTVLMLGDPKGLAGLAGVALASRGAGVAFCCEGSAAGRQACLDAAGAGGSAMALAMDSGNPESIAGIAGAVIDHWGRIDAVVFAESSGFAREAAPLDAVAAACMEIGGRRGWGESRALILAGKGQWLCAAARNALAGHKRAKPNVHIIALGHAQSEIPLGAAFSPVANNAEAVNLIVARFFRHGSEETGK